MRTLLIVACLAVSACSDAATQIARDAGKDCREARDRAEYVAGLRKSFGQQPALPDDIRKTVDELCSLAPPDEAEAIAEAAIRAN